MRDVFARCLPGIFLAVFALMRWPGLLPENLSAVYGVVFCSGVFLRTRAWVGASFVVLLLTDILLSLHYRFNKGFDVFTSSALLFLAVNYAGYSLIFLLGRHFRRSAAWLSLIAGGVLGALLFYLVTNTAAWLFNPFHNPEYTRSLQGWITALTRGTSGYPETWTFFRNTLLGGGLFTALFSGVWKFSGAESPADKGEEAPGEAPEAEPEPGEAGA